MGWIKGRSGEFAEQLFGLRRSGTKIWVALHGLWSGGNNYQFFTTRSNKRKLGTFHIKKVGAFFNLPFSIFPYPPSPAKYHHRLISSIQQDGCSC
jgi:hypothetical protein